MKYHYIAFVAVILMACNLSNPAIPGIEPTVVPPPMVISETLSITPIEGLSDDGSVLLTPLTTVTVSWDGLQEGVSATFILGDFLSDGGVMEIGQGRSASFTVFERLEGYLTASATLADGTTLNAQTVPVLTGNMITGDCQYLPPALGPGVDLLAEASLTASDIGDVVYNADYLVLAKQDGVDDKDATLPFYQIQEVGTNFTGWVRSNVGENLAGDCSVFQ